MTGLPTLFVSHGAPTFAIDPGLAGPELTALGQALPTPKAILVVSPHWTTPAARATTSTRPGTLHDFRGFAPELYEIQYPVNGEPTLAARAIELLTASGWPTTADERRGLDHGAWVPLLYLYPNANVAAFQVSMPSDLDVESAYRFGQALTPLRDEGVLIIGSGSLTHNLGEVSMEHRHGEAYVREFANWVREAVEQGRHSQLLDTLNCAPHALRAHPTTEHLLPLFIALGASGRRGTAQVIEGGIRHGVLAMDTFVFNQA
ncbi:MAG: class III extradiol ring-cleavage dioxygenase [Marinobacter sp.]|uniref:dioxygenase n=1 Tax=Marinobacter sp. TaxID=50741 RepID=UPI0034A03810